MTTAMLALLLAASPFAFEERGGTSLDLKEDGRPVFSYNYGRMWQEGAPKDRARCCYLHPVHAPNGTVVTDDFPKDHYHHRGISWMWPIVNRNGVRHDLWILKGIHRHFVRWLERRVEAERAVLSVENVWTIDGKEVAREQVSIVTHRAQAGRRDIDFTLRFEALGEDLELSGAPEERKGYGGFNVRFAPRENTVIRAGGKEVPRDSDNDRYPWAEMSAVYSGKTATLRITDDPANPGHPIGWCLRKYGFLGANFPGRESYKLSPGKPLVLRYRITLASE